MDSFRVYLPSNASMDLFPDNKPSDFKVQMNPPLHLEGKWEIGVENVCYHSAIANVEENAQITLTARTYELMSMNELFNYSYVLTNDGKWNYDWIQLESNYYGDSDMPKVRDTLNMGNKLILKDKKKKVYNFFLSLWSNRLFYAFKSYSSGLAMRFNDDLMQHLGFGYSEHVTNGKADVERVDHSGKIKKSNYQFKFFDSNVVACEERIILKKENEKALSLTALVQRWNEIVGRKYGEMSEAKKNKFILHKKNDKLTLAFSPSMHGVVRHYSAIIGSGTFWGSHAYTITKNSNLMEWYVDIYGDRIKTVRQREKEMKTVIEFPVRQYATVEDVIRKLNSHMKFTMEYNLGSNYDDKKYAVSFKIVSQRTILTLGSEMKAELTEHFANLFGFAQKTFTDKVTTSLESPMTLDKREQHLYIQSNVINPIPFGDKKEYILRGFIHDKDSKYGIMEKIFEPILYHPVMKENISTINLCITNGLRERIHLKDTKTLITLIFRRAK